MLAYFVLGDNCIVGLVKVSYFFFVFCHFFQTLVLFGENNGKKRWDEKWRLAALKLEQYECSPQVSSCAAHLKNDGTFILKFGGVPEEQQKLRVINSFNITPCL